MGTCTDLAGNSASVTVLVKVDLTAPTVTSNAEPAANQFDWNNTDVTVSFSCTDALSGVASCSAPQTVTSEGADQVVTGTVAAAYGDLLDPNDPGSGGGSDGGVGGNGGGVLLIDAGTIILNGLILADGRNGTDCCSGGGSGGSVRVDVVTLSGLGSIRANGGVSSSTINVGGGGGGRVAIYYSDATGFNLSRVFALGGSGLNNGDTGSVSLVVVP